MATDVHGDDGFQFDLFGPGEEDCNIQNGIIHSEVAKVNSKVALVSPSEDDFDILLSRLKCRIKDGMGETIYEVGVGDGGDSGLNNEDLKASVATLECMAGHLNCATVLLREKETEDGKVAEYLVRETAVEDDFCEVRVAVVGNVDAGKSTLLGVLTHGALDDGRGTARLKLFRHKHEVESGRTSSVGNDILGFDSKGDIVNKPDPHSGALDWQRICRDSAKVLTFIDLAGHEKYLKTTVFGMTGHSPDYAMLMIGSNMGVVGMTKEHLGLALALNVPVFVVITKIDMCPANVLQDTMKLLCRILKSPGCRKIPVVVQNRDDLILSAANFTSERICPIFQISNVTGENIDLLKIFLNLLSARSSFVANEPAIFQIDDTYSVPGVGTVVSGTTLQGVVHLNDVLMLGPDSTGGFQPLPIKSIHRKRMPVKEVRAGQTASFSLKKIKRQDIRKGMVMASRDLDALATWEFEAEVLVLHHPTTISPRYQAMVHCGSLRQTATILTMDKEHLRTGDRAMCRFRFIKNPEFILPGTKMIFREGRTKAVGTITKLFHDIPGQSSHNMRTGKSTKAQMHHKAQQANRSRTVGKKPQNNPHPGHAANAVKTGPIKQVTATANGNAVGHTGQPSTAIRTPEPLV